jgi:penicillin-binding protein 1C
VRGTEQALMRAGAQTRAPVLAGIANPVDGTIYALDPDIPPAAQRLLFEGQAGTWILNGRRLGQGTRLAWSPWPGRHQLQLLDPRGQVLQSVRFEVRGAGLKQVR